MQFLAITLIFQVIPILIAVHRVHSRTKQIIAINLITFFISLIFTYINIVQITENNTITIITWLIWGAGWIGSLLLNLTKNTTPPEVIAAKKDASTSWGDVLPKIFITFVVYFIIKSIVSPRAPEMLPANTVMAEQIAYELGATIGIFTSIYLFSFLIAMINCRKSANTIKKALPSCAYKALKYTIVFCIIGLFMHGKI